MSELRQEIARAILEVSNRFIAPNFPKGFQLRGFDELDERELRLHLAYADAILALPLISKAEQRGAERPRPLSEWDEGMGDVLWWKFPIEEPPYVGTPLDIGFTVGAQLYNQFGDVIGKTENSVGGWPGYHTHWTPIMFPDQPLPAEEEAA